MDISIIENLWRYRFPEYLDGPIMDEARRLLAEHAARVESLMRHPAAEPTLADDVLAFFARNSDICPSVTVQPCNLIGHEGDPSRLTGFSMRFSQDLHAHADRICSRLLPEEVSAINAFVDDCREDFVSYRGGDGRLRVLAAETLCAAYRLIAIGALLMETRTLRLGTEVLALSARCVVWQSNDRQRVVAFNGYAIWSGVAGGYVVVP